MVAAQVITSLTHAGCAGAAARMLPPEAFGMFAGRLSFSNGGLGLAVLRALHLDERERGGDDAVAWGLGLVGLLGTLAIAERWSRPWGVEESRSSCCGPRRSSL